MSSSKFNMPISSNNLLSKIKHIGGGINTTTYLLIGLLILFAVIAALYYYYYVLPKFKTSYKPNSELNAKGSANSGQEAELLFFFANWCPYCKTAKPVWNQLKSEYENKTINGYAILFTEVDCSEESDTVSKMMDKYSVEGYPTIKLLKDGQVIEYDAKIDKKTLEQFLNTVL